MVSLLAVKLVRDTRRQWLQFGAVALTLALGVAVFGAAYDSYDNLKTSYNESYKRLRFADFTITGGDSTAIANAVEQQSGVSAVSTRLQADLPFRVTTSDGVHTLLGRIVGQPDGAEAPINRLLIEQGSGVPGAGTDGVVLERHMAEHFHLNVGSTLEVFSGAWRPVRVAGIAVSPEYLWPARSRQDLLTSGDDFGVAFVADRVVADLAGTAATQQVLVRSGPGVDAGELGAEVRAVATQHGAGDVVSRSDQASNAALQQDVESFSELAVLFPMLFLVAGALAAYVLLGRLVRVQRAQIGMLRANGYPRRRLLRHYVAFGAAAGFCGSVVGAAGGIALAVWLTRTYTSTLGIPLAVSRFHPLTPILGVAIGTLAAVVAALAPARAAAGVAPADAMRGDLPAGVGHHSVVERMPGVRGLPVRATLAIRNVQRSPRRAFSTGVGVALAAVLVLSSLGMLDTVSLVFDEQFHDVQRQDAQLYLTSAGSEQTKAAIASIPGVAAVEPALEVPIVLSSGVGRYQTALTGLATDTRMHRFTTPLPSTGIVLGDALRSILHVGIGDMVDVSVGNAAPTSVAIAGFVHEPLGSLAYSTIDFAQTLAGASGLHSILVRYSPGVDPAAMPGRLVDVPGVVAVRDVRGSEETVRQLLALFYAIVGFMLLFGSILAFVVMFNTLSVNLSERTVEIATLRAAGGRVSTLARLTTVENTLLVVAAIPFGLLAGWVTGRWLMSSFNSDLYHLTLRLRPTTPLLLAAGLIAVAVVMHIPTRRNIKRLDVARVVRERAL